MFKDVVIVSQARTAVGGFGGSLKDFNSIDLATIVIKEAIKRASIDPKEVDETVMGVWLSMVLMHFYQELHH